MSNHLEHLLDVWYPQRDSLQWVLATIVETKGSAYRKAGAKMLVNSMGQSFGLLSGGCLESDLMRQAQKCWAFGKDRVVVYDMQDDADIAWQLGIGCGGMVKVLLQPINQSNNYHDLVQLRKNLIERVTCYYQLVSEHSTIDSVSASRITNRVLGLEQVTPDYQLKNIKVSSVLISKIKPRPSIAIVGGGMDSLPLVNIASSMGWHISLFDSRINHARSEHFKNADEIIKQPYHKLVDCPRFYNADLIIIMNHNVSLDAQALLAAEQSKALYIGILGPKHRTEEKVLIEAGIKRAELTKPLFSPVGLDLGGELPESIALSIISQAHAYLEKASALPLAGKN